MNEYAFEVNIVYESRGIQADNLLRAKRSLKEIFKDEHNIELDDKEIKVTKIIRGV